MPRKLPKLEHVKRVRAHGRVYLYFNTGRKVNGNAEYALFADLIGSNPAPRWFGHVFKEKDFLFA